MYYYKARIYSPRLGRFMQTDPIGYEDQYNLYAYVGNDPINGMDPTGLSKCQISGACDESGLDGLEGTRGSGTRIGSIVLLKHVRAIKNANASSNTSSINLGSEGRGYNIEQTGAQEDDWQIDDPDPDSITEQVIDGLLELNFFRGSPACGSNTGGPCFPYHGYEYAPRVRQRQMEDPNSHGFPYSFDHIVIEHGKRLLEDDGYIKYTLPGSFRSYKGVFEIGITKKGVIDHRFFRPTR